MAEPKCIWRYDATKRIGNDEKHVCYRCTICSAKHSIVTEIDDDNDYRPEPQSVATCTYYRPVKGKRNAAV